MGRVWEVSAMVHTMIGMALATETQALRIDGIDGIVVRVNYCFD